MAGITKVDYKNVKKSIDEKYDKWWERILMKILMWYMSGGAQLNSSRKG